MSDLYDKEHDAEIVRLNDRIIELEASLADAASRAKVYGDALLALTPGGSEYFNGDFTVDEQACTHHIRERFKELHELKCEKVRAKAEGHSANTVGGPTPGAAPACERKE